MLANVAAAVCAAGRVKRCARVTALSVAWGGMGVDRCYSLLMARVRSRWFYIALTTFSVTFLASPSSIMVLSR
jgi:hypothetical protein